MSFEGFVFRVFVGSVVFLLVLLLVRSLVG